MRGELPLEPTGTDPEAMFARSLHRKVHGPEMRINSSSTVKVSRTTNGIFLRAAAARGASSGMVLMKVVSYNQDATNGDYLVCRPAGAAEDGSGDVNVAVEPHLQSRILTQTMPNGDEWAFTDYTDDIDTDPQQRTSTKGTTVLTEYISPPFLDTDIVPVWTCLNSGVTVDDVDVKLVALTGRQWASA